MAIENPPRSSLPLGLIIALSSFGLLVTIVFAVMMIRSFGHRSADRIVTGSIRIAPVTGSIPIAPAPLPMRQAETIAVSPLAQSGETALNESTADLVLASGSDKTFIKTFALGDDATFSLKNLSGGITVTVWDQFKVEVKAIPSNSDQGGQVFFKNDNGRLSIRTGPNRGNQDVRYEIKLPRGMGRIEINSVNGSIKLYGVTGQILAESSNGNIDLIDVVGVSKAQTTNGKITAVLGEATDGPMQLTAVNGKIDLTIKSGFDATLDASTVHGSLDIGEQFGIEVQKEVVGQRARGQIGSGGGLLKLTTVNGSIKLSNHNAPLPPAKAR